MGIRNYANPAAIQGWHPGETIMQRKMGYDQVPGLDQMWQFIYPEMTDQHRTFHTSNLHLLPIVTLDEKGRPWSSVLAAGDGKIGWIKSVKSGPSRLEMKPKVWAGDPFWDNVGPFGEEGSDGVLFAGVGVEVATRRRNKMAGKIRSLRRNEENREVTLTAHVYENTGNCPKYITVRSVEPRPDTHPLVVHDKFDLDPSSPDRLPSSVVDFIHAADTIWLGSVFASSSPNYPSHLGMNHRGGRPGWVRVKPSDGRTVVLPDWSGNRFMSTLGNIEATPVASVTVVDWETGDVLYLTGDAVNLVGDDAEKVMPMQKALTELKVTGYRFVKDALPVRQRAGVEVEMSPYNPPVKLLREELEAQGVEILGGSSGLMPQAKLEKIDLHSPTIATFTFRPSVPLRIRPGQAIILDFKSLLGTPRYKHMAADKPSSVNDDLIRTWTVSSYHPPLSPTEEGAQDQPPSFDLTIKEKEGGLVTGALFQLARSFEANEVDAATQNVQAGIVGISGEFYLDLEKAHSSTDLTSTSRRLVWAAGGIGVTPFITMLRALATSPSPSIRSRPWDIVFLLSTREPGILLPLIAEVHTGAALSNVRLRLHVFTNEAISRVPSELPCELTFHKGRPGPVWFKQEKQVLEGREAFLCGPPTFENIVIDALVQEVGLEKGMIQKEGFAY